MRMSERRSETGSQPCYVNSIVTPSGVSICRRSSRCMGHAMSVEEDRQSRWAELKRSWKKPGSVPSLGPRPVACRLYRAAAADLAAARRRSRPRADRLRGVRRGHGLIYERSSRRGNLSTSSPTATGDRCGARRALGLAGRYWRCPAYGRLGPVCSRSRLRYGPGFCGSPGGTTDQGSAPSGWRLLDVRPDQQHPGGMTAFVAGITWGVGTGLSSRTGCCSGWQAWPPMRGTRLLGEATLAHGILSCPASSSPVRLVSVWGGRCSAPPGDGGPGPRR